MYSWHSTGHVTVYEDVSFCKIVNVLMRKNCVMIVSSLSSTSVCVWLFVCQLNKW